VRWGAWLVRIGHRSHRALMKAESYRIQLALAVVTAVAAYHATVDAASAAQTASDSENAALTLAAQLRKQGVACSEPRNARPDLNASIPHAKVWALDC